MNAKNLMIKNMKNNNLIVEEINKLNSGKYYIHFITNTINTYNVFYEKDQLWVPCNNTMWFHIISVHEYMNSGLLIAKGVINDGNLENQIDEEIEIMLNPDKFESFNDGTIKTYIKNKNNILVKDPNKFGIKLYISSIISKEHFKELFYTVNYEAFIKFFGLSSTVCNVVTNEDKINIYTIRFFRCREDILSTLPDKTVIQLFNNSIYNFAYTLSEMEHKTINPGCFSILGYNTEKMQIPYKSYMSTEQQEHLNKLSATM